MAAFRLWTRAGDGSALQTLAPCQICFIIHAMGNQGTKKKTNRRKFRDSGLITLIKKTLPATQFELGFRFVAVYLFLPLFSSLMRLSYRLAGYNYVRSDNLSNILKNPWAIVYLILIVIIYSFMVLYEISMLMHLTNTNFNTKVLGMRALSKVVVRQNLSFLRKHPFTFILMLLFFAPLFSVSFSSPLLPKFKIPGFIMDTIMQSTLFSFIFFAAILLLFFLALASVFTFHGVYLDDLPLIRSAKQSIRIFRKHGLRIFWRILWVQAVLMLIFGILAIIVMFLLGMVVVEQIEHHRRLIVLLALSASLKSTGQWILGAFSIALFIAITTQLYRKYAPEVGIQGTDISSEGIIACESFEVLLHLNSNPMIYNKSAKRSKLKWVVIIPAIFLAVLTFEGVRIYLMLNSDFAETLNPNVVLVTAHRGFIQNAPENSLAAVQESIDAFADYVEIDVQLSKDGQVVVFHDPTLKRMTGDKRKLQDLTYRELKELRFLPAHAKKYPNERIPLLADVLELGKGKIRFNIELKPPGRSSAELAEAVVKVIKDKAMEDKVILASLNLDALKKAKQLAPEIRSMYILPFVQGNFYEIPEIDYYSIEENNINEKLVARLHSGNHQVHAWTVNDEDAMRRLADLNVDNIITDFPLVASETLVRNTPEQRIDAQVFDWLLPIVEILSVRQQQPQ